QAGVGRLPSSPSHREVADVAERDDERQSDQDREVAELTAQVSYMEKELSVLRRKLADSPRHVRLLEERLREAQTNLAGANSQNEKLVTTLKEAREQIVALKEEVDRLAQPPSGFGAFLGARADEAGATLSTGGHTRAHRR